MDLELTDEQRAIRETITRFREKHLLPLEPEFLRRARTGEDPFGRDVIGALQAEARKLGFWGLGTPQRFGGMELPALDQSLIYTELAKTCIPFLIGGEADNILYESDESQIDEFLVPTIEGERISCFGLTEPGAGSDVAAIRTSARRSGDDWILSGEKTFITHGHDADFAIVIAVTDPDAGPHHGSTAFLVDRSMGWTSHRIDVMGWHSPASLVFDDVRVPGRNVLGGVGCGFELAMRWIGRGRYIVSSQAVGIAERLLTMAIEYARMRTTFGSPLADRQAIQWMIADSEVEIEAARWLTLRAAWSIDQGSSGARHAASIAKLNAAGMVNRVVDRVMQIHGGIGYAKELPIEYWYRAVRVFRIFEGSDEVQRMIISRDLLSQRSTVGLP